MAFDDLRPGLRHAQAIKVSEAHGAKRPLLRLPERPLYGRRGSTSVVRGGSRERRFLGNRALYGVGCRGLSRVTWC
jgi:hypothetical protein